MRDPGSATRLRHAGGGDNDTHASSDDNYIHSPGYNIRPSGAND
ncbi:hypothetical protein [Actinokineospora inagensis]